MGELLTPPDVEGICVASIKDAFRSGEASGVRVSTKIPTSGGKTLDEFVRVIALGGVDDTLVSGDERVMLEGWAATEVRAHRLWALALAALTHDAVRMVSARRLGGPSNDPHSDYPALSRYSGQVGVRVRLDASPLS